MSEIGKRSDSQLVYQRIYTELVLGTLKLIADGRKEDAYTLYREYSLTLAKTYC